MKQEYISPEIEIIEFETEDVITESLMNDSNVKQCGGFYDEFEEDV